MSKLRHFPSSHSIQTSRPHHQFIVLFRNAPNITVTTVITTFRIFFQTDFFIKTIA